MNNKKFIIVALGDLCFKLENNPTISSHSILLTYIIQTYKTFELILRTMNSLVTLNVLKHNTRLSI